MEMSKKRRLFLAVFLSLFFGAGAFAGRWYNETYPDGAEQKDPYDDACLDPNDENYDEDYCECILAGGSEADCEDKKGDGNGNENGGENGDGNSTGSNRFPWFFGLDGNDGDGDGNGNGNGVNGGNGGFQGGAVEGKNPWNNPFFGDKTNTNSGSVELTAYVDILASETNDGPDDVDSTTAPLADGADYWRVRVQFFNEDTTEFLTAEEVESVSIVPQATSDSKVFMNQVEDTGDAVAVSSYNLYLGCTTTETCVLTEAEDGSVSFNTFIYSGAPTSNMLGLNSDEDSELEYHSDREGCKWIYNDQGGGVETPDEQDCEDGSSTVYDKADVFYDRKVDRNRYELESIQVELSLKDGREFEMATYEDTFEEVGDHWEYYPEEGTAELSYRPRYQITQFATMIGDEEYMSISSDTSEIMSLSTEATVSNTSAAYQAGGGADKPKYLVTYQMDATSSNAEVENGDLKLLVDTDTPAQSPTSGDVEETTRTDTLEKGSIGYANYTRNYAIGYGQSAAICGLSGACSAPTNTLSEPSAEQWVCDQATERTMGVPSCYYTDYLSHLDRHATAESMLVIGAINSLIDAGDILEATSEKAETALSVLGTTETINLRNKMYAQVTRYTLGQNAGSGSFDSKTGEASSGLVELMGGRLIFAEGDVFINGFDGSDKTLVVIGGDVFLNTDITNGRMGIVAFKRDGEGGNVYLKNTVTDLYANFFLDGSLFSYDGTPPSTVYPQWGGDEIRLETLMNQLYLKGSLVSHNTVGGATDSDGDGLYELGDGTTTAGLAQDEGYEVAQEYDLNMLRQFRLCHPIVNGVIDTNSTEPCGEGELLSAYGTVNEIYNSFILEYNPANDLPIFSVESGLFR